MLLIICLLNSMLSGLLGLIVILYPTTDWTLWPQRWLLGTPFQNMRMPGVFFLLLIGLSNAWGCWNVMRETPRQYERAMMGGYAMVVWVTSEILLNRDLYLVHLSALMIGAIQILLAYQQKNKWAL